MRLSSVVLFLVFSVSCTTGESQTRLRLDQVHQHQQGSCLRYVNGAISSSGDGMSWATAFKTVQEGIFSAHAAGSCAVWVSEGTYFVYETSAFDSIHLMPGVSVYGGFSGNETSLHQRRFSDHASILDGKQSTTSSLHVKHVVIGCDNATLDGFVVKNGKAHGGGFFSGRGGGMINFGSPLVRNCTFVGNSASKHGGAIFNFGSSPSIFSSSFVSNTAGRSGGAICSFGGAPTIQDCNITGNNAGRDGGGLAFFKSSPSISRSQVLHNIAGHSGGGIRFSSGSPSISNSRFVGNSASKNGGALSATRSSLSFSNLILSKNTAGKNGGGIYNRAFFKHPTIVNSLFYGNEAGKKGGGLFDFSSSSTVVTNSIFWSNSAIVSGPQIQSVGSLSVSYSDIEGGFTGQNNIDADPLFERPGVDFHLKQNSPCANTGDFSSAPSISLNGILVNPGNVGIGPFIPAAFDPLDYACVVRVDLLTPEPDPLLQNGDSWATAYASIQDGVDAAEQHLLNDMPPPPLCAVWIADGIYRIYVDSSWNSVWLKSNVHVFGGYLGWTAGLSELEMSERDLDLYETILSGEDELLGLRVNSILIANLLTNFSIDGLIVERGGNHTFQGGGLSATGAANTGTVNRCVFRENEAGGGGAIAAGRSIDSSGTIIDIVDSVFLENSCHGSDGGAALHFQTTGAMQVVGCSFLGNEAVFGIGTAIQLFETNGITTITDSVLVNNSCPSSQPNCSAAIVASDSRILPRAGLVVADTVFSGNSSASGAGGGWGAAINAYQIDPFSVTGSIFVGNVGRLEGGAVFNRSPNASVVNSSFVGNSVVNSGCAGLYKCAGGGIYNSSRGVEVASIVDVVNCTFAANEAQTGGASLASEHCTVNTLAPAEAYVWNSIFWRGVSASGDCDKEVLNIVDTNCDPITEMRTSYLEISSQCECQDQSRYPDWQWDDYITNAALGNVGSTFDEYPEFEDSDIGVTDSIIPYPGEYKTGFIDSSKSWAPDSLKGKYVRVPSASPKWYVIYSNSINDFVVWGDVQIVAPQPYEIHSLRLKKRSPLVDTGTDSVASAVDLVGNQRGDVVGVGREGGAPVDMGAYEVPLGVNGTACSLESQCFSTHCTDGICCDSTCTGDCRSCDRPGFEGTCTFLKAGTDPSLECGGGCQACDGNGACGGATPGTDKFDACPGSCGENGLCREVMFVDWSASAGGSGTSWIDAHNDIADAIASLNPPYLSGPAEVWVASGRYYVYKSLNTDTIMLKNDVLVLGGFDCYGAGLMASPA